MLLGPLAVTGLLVGADWGLWDWSLSANHATLALVAGLAMAPLAVAFVWCAARALAAAAGTLLRRAESELRARTQGPPRRPRTTAQIGDPAAASDQAPERLAA